jgi:hypothetical protein
MSITSPAGGLGKGAVPSDRLARLALATVMIGAFVSFTSIFFSLAVTWQEGFGHGALASIARGLGAGPATALVPAARS